jgi:hypothetical protein
MGGMQMFSFPAILLASMGINLTDYKVQGDIRTWDKNFDGAQLNSVYCFNDRDFPKMTEFHAYVKYCVHSLFGKSFSHLNI